MHPWLVVAGPIEIPTYLTSLMVGFALATFPLRREALRRDIPPRLAMDLALWSIPVVLVGARLAHAVLEAPRLYWSHPWELLQFAYGGFVFYGGLLAGGILLVRFSQRHGLSPWRMGDVFAPATTFGLAFGRLGCLGGGCCYGKPADWPLGVAVPWGIRYHHRGHVPEPLLATSLHPAPLYEAIFALSLFVGLSLWAQRRQRVDGEVLLGFIGIYGLGRAALEVVRADVERGMYLGGWLSTSQAIGLASAAVSLGWLVARRRAAGEGA